jgi:hypothetical protein
MPCRKRWERDVGECRREGGACGSGVRGLVIARVMVPGHLWIVIVWERGEKLSSGSKGGERNHVHVDEPLALVLTPAACQALLWATGVLLGRSSEVLERGGLGTNGDGTKGVPCTGPGYNEELEFDLELPGVTYPLCGN